MLAESYLGLNGKDVSLTEGAREEAREQGERIAAAVNSRPDLAPSQVEAIMNRVRERQRAVGYDGSYRGWIARMTPPDLQ